ncbi:MAG: phosphotransferase [Steroidobacteraceae bacterium]
MTFIPTSIQQIDRAWFAAAIGPDVSDAQIVKVIHGTATKVKVDLVYSDERKQTVWVKTGLEPHSRSIGNDRVYAGETFFYRNFNGKYETRTPRCLFADTDQHGNSAIVMEDLEQQGATFVDAALAGSPDLIARGLEAIARYQAASWMDPELDRNDYLRSGGSYDTADVLGWLWNEAHWTDYAKRQRFQALAPELRDRRLLHRAHATLRRDWRMREPWSLSHGDAHFGQLYTLPGGEARLLDWQCCQLAHWAYDVSYFLISGLSVADRRACARDLLSQHVMHLRELGVRAAPSADAAYEAFRAYALHGIGWCMCMVEMQPEDICTAMTERFSSAIVDLTSVDIVLNKAS